MCPPTEAPKGHGEHMDIHRLEQEVMDSGADGKGWPTVKSARWESGGCRAFGLAKMPIWWYSRPKVGYLVEVPYWGSCIHRTIWELVFMAH